MTESLPPPDLVLDSEADASVVRLTGGWTTNRLLGLEKKAKSFSWPSGQVITLNGSAIGPLDTSGAWLIRRLVGQLEGQGKRVAFRGFSQDFIDLIELVGDRLQLLEESPARREHAFLERVGRGAWTKTKDMFALVSFVGETTVALMRQVVNPGRIRWRTLAKILEETGLKALPIVGLLSFLLGIVIAYQGGVQLATYGANIFIVELVSLIMLRELAPLIAAIIIAGRTGSAYTAEIGTMKVTEEVDALETIGIGPFDQLVLPKVLGLMVTLPLLTVFADVMGVLGGMVMASTVLDVSFTDFLTRMPQAVSVTSFIVGVVKAPVFAMIISVVGCFQGFRVSGGADSVGKQTTISVVQSIFLVIIADAIFSIIFSWIGI